MRCSVGIAWGAALSLGSLAPGYGQTQPRKAQIASPPVSRSLANKDALAKFAATERAYYTVCMNLIQREWENKNRARVLELLEETKDSPYRSFEWGYWNRLCHREIRMLPQNASAVAVSADGRWVATGGGGGTVQVWDAASGKQLWNGQEKPIKGWAGYMNAIAFTPDGKRLLTSDSESTTVVWDAKTGAVQRTLFGGNSGTRAAFSQDGSRIVLNARGTWGAIRDLESGKDLLKNKDAQYNAFDCIAFAPDGTHFVSCSDDKVARLWDAKTGEALRTFEGHQQPIVSVDFSPDGREIVTASPDQTVKLWDAATGKELRTLAGNPGEVWVVCFSPDGKSLATGSTDGTARIWDAETGKEKREFIGHTRGVGAIAFFPDGKRLVTGSGDGATKIWDLTKGEEEVLEKRPVPSRPDPANPEIRQVMYGRFVGKREFSPDGKLVIVTRGNNEQVWDIPSGKQLCALEGHTAPIDVIAISPDSRWIATGSSDKTAKFWEVRTGKLIQTLTGHSATVNALAFLADSHRIVTAGDDGTAKIWDSFSGKVVRTLKSPAGVVGVGVYLGGSRIVTGGREGLARVWDSATGRQVGSLEGGAGLIGWMTLSPEGDRAVSYYPYTVQLWNVTTGKVIRTLPINAGFSRGIAFSPDRRRVVVGNDAGEIAMWDLDTGKELLTLPHSAHRISSVQFTEDGKRLTIECSDGYAYALLSDPGR